MEENVANHLSDKGLVSTIHQRTLTTQQQKDNLIMGKGDFPVVSG